MLHYVVSQTHRSDLRSFERYTPTCYRDIYTQILSLSARVFVCVFFPVSTITYEPLHAAWYNLA